MKIYLNHQPELQEIEVHINYPKEDMLLDTVVSQLNSCKYTINVFDENQNYKVPVASIYYIETVDRKTFVYSKESVLRTNLKLYQLLEKIERYDFVQISRTCILNMNVLDSIKMLSNSRLEAILSNGEKVTVSRKYLPRIKARFQAEGGCSYEG